MYDLGSIITLVLHASVNMSPQVIHICGYRPPYHSIYITYYMYYINTLNRMTEFHMTG